MIAIGIVKTPFTIRGFQSYNNMGHFSLWADYKYDVTRTYFTNVLQLTTWIRFIPENKRINHASISSTSIYITDTIMKCDAISLCARDFILVGIRSIMSPPNRTSRPIFLNLAEQFQHIFFCDRLAIRQVAIPNTWNCYSRSISRIDTISSTPLKLLGCR